MNRNNIIALAASVLVLLLLGCIKSEDQIEREYSATIWAESVRLDATAEANRIKVTATADARNSKATAQARADATWEARRVHELEIEQKRIEAAAELIEENADAYVKQKNADTLDYMVKAGEDRQDRLIEHVIDEKKPNKVMETLRELTLIVILVALLAFIWWLYGLKRELEEPPEDEFGL